jgi:hypothetical protein
VADEFVGGADLRCGAEVGEFGWGVAEGFLRPVGEGCEEVFEKGSLFVHASSFTRSQVVSRYGTTCDRVDQKMREKAPALQANRRSI